MYVTSWDVTAFFSLSLVLRCLPEDRHLIITVYIVWLTAFRTAYIRVTYQQSMTKVRDLCDTGRNVCASILPFSYLLREVSTRIFYVKQKPLPGYFPILFIFSLLFKTFTASHQRDYFPFIKQQKSDVISPCLTLLIPPSPTTKPIRSALGIFYDSKCHGSEIFSPLRKQ